MVGRIDLGGEHGVDRQRRWFCGGTQSYAARSVTFGRLAGGRWWADATGHLADPGGAFVYDASERGKALALRLAYRWMREAGGDWRPWPAAFDAHGRPVDGLPWVRRGAQWFLEG